MSREHCVVTPMTHTNTHTHTYNEEMRFMLCIGYEELEISTTVDSS